MALKDCKELNDFVDALIEDGFNGLKKSIVYGIFSDDYYLNHRDLHWRDPVTPSDRFKEFSEKFALEQRVDGEYGGEGEGEYCYGVIKLGEKYYKAEWSYYSFNGCGYDYIEDTVKEVFPVQKVITVYE